jgi:hypothetical protein
MTKAHRGTAMGLLMREATGRTDWGDLCELPKRLRP